MRGWFRRMGYKQHGPCHECGKRAVRPQMSLWWGHLDTYQCDACGEIFEDETLVITDPKRDSPIYSGEAVNPDNLDSGTAQRNWPKRTLEILTKPVNAFREIEPDDPDITLTPHQKSKKYLSNACFIFAILFGITIIGIPIAILFLVLATWLTPDPYKQVGDENNGETEQESS